MQLLLKRDREGRREWDRGGEFGNEINKRNPANGSQKMDCEFRGRSVCQKVVGTYFVETGPAKQLKEGSEHRPSPLCHFNRIKGAMADQ